MLMVVPLLRQSKLDGHIGPWVNIDQCNPQNTNELLIQEAFTTRRQ